MLDFMLYNDDCLKRMKKMVEQGIKVDCILTDPPYELDTHKGGVTDFAQRKLVKENHIEFISNGFNYEECFNLMLKLCKVPNLLIFCSNKQISKVMSYFESKKFKGKHLSVTLLMWEKTNPIPLGNGKHISDVEFIVYVRGKNAPFNNNCNLKYKYKVKTYPTIGKSRLHPTEKPLELIKELLTLHTLKGNVILDCFMGGGTTGEAVLELGENRKFIGIEIDKGFYDVSLERLNGKVNKGDYLYDKGENDLCVSV